MKKLLFQFDTDAMASVFDIVVGYDGGADHVVSYGGVNPENVGALIDGTIFTRSPKEKRFTAIFIGGGNLDDGQKLLKAVKKKFFADFRVSIMFDSNGSNTTAAAGVALLAKTAPLKGKRAVVLAGTGPVGQRAAALLAEEGADVVITSRQKARAEMACRQMEERFGVKLTAVEATDSEARSKACEGAQVIFGAGTGNIAPAQVVFGAGAAGVQLLEAKHWQENKTIEMMADTNATPPLGFEGVDMMDKGKERNGKIVYGAIGLGALKLKLHRACIAQLFERNDQVLDAEEIYAVAKRMAAEG
ncbi:MAG: NADP-dependent methylenetetrahydromethanopterin/methylenetetrahydrofolate dehydrogenase [Burkholderiales bacterium]|nr:SDR family NAD(P)-dependent oxidoreductase [Burkholderiales bacterium]MDQ3196498.1 NADP-dependent methylenetetrahydromethanopterin/methylenetetrahydrofolate dehydrogenase [Pseudomonadota bacterium]